MLFSVRYVSGLFIDAIHICDDRRQYTEVSAIIQPLQFLSIIFQSCIFSVPAAG